MRKAFVGALATAVLLTLGVGVRGTPTEGRCKVSELEEAAPEQLAGPVREALAETGYRVTDESDKGVCDIWLRRDVPLLGKFQEQVDLKYAIEPGTLAGAIRFATAGKDFRNQTVKPGVYTLRYGQQPQDGNHLGTATYRDFLIIVPADQDKTVREVTQEKAMQWSKKAAGSSHPAILSLMPPQKDRDRLPAMAHEASLDLQILVAKTSGRIGDKDQELQIELVVVGHAAE